MIMTKGYAEQKLSPDKLVADHMHIVRKIAWHMFGLGAWRMLRKGAAGLRRRDQTVRWPQPKEDCYGRAQTRINRRLFDDT